MDVVGQLEQIVGERYVVTDPALTAANTTDWTGMFSGPALAVVRPGSVGEVSDVLRVCAAARQPVLPQGGVTGLVAASVPAPPGSGRPPIILSTLRLNSLGAVDQAAGQVTAGAGVTLAVLRNHAAAAGWEYGVDIAARDSATIGGNVATNAGGIRVCAYGMTRSQVIGIEAVLPDGSVVSHLHGMPKDNTGYDLVGLLVGSEGTLGVVTAVTVRLHRPVSESTLALVGVHDYAEALAMLAAATGQGVRLLAAEVFDRQGTELVCELAGLPWPLANRDWDQLLLLDVEGPDIELPDGADAIVAADAADVKRIWSYRELQSEAASLLTHRERAALHKLDISVPLHRMQQFADELAQLLDSDLAVTASTIFGHIADGNLHIEIVGPAIDDDRATGAALRLVASHGGSISAEHGVGRTKAKYLSLSRSAAEIAAMRAIKNALDPYWLISPGVLFEVAGPTG